VTEEKLSPWEKKALIEKLAGRQKQAMRDYDDDLYDMLESRLVELRAPEPEPPEAWEYPAATKTSPQTPPEPSNGAPSAYEQLLAEMERAYKHISSTFAWATKKFKTQWAKARKNIPEKHGWTEETFYAELDRRTKLKNNIHENSKKQAAEDTAYEALSE